MTKRFARLLAISFILVSLSLTLADAVEEIKIASTGPGVSTLPLEIAARKGFFRSEGLEVLTITMRTNIAINALLSRNVDYATPSTSIIKAATAGLPVKLIAVLLGRPDYFLTVKERGKIDTRLERQTRRHRQFQRRCGFGPEAGRETRGFGPRSRSDSSAYGRRRFPLRVFDRPAAWMRRS